MERSLSVNIVVLSIVNLHTHFTTRLYTYKYFMNDSRQFMFIRILMIVYNVNIRISNKSIGTYECVRIFQCVSWSSRASVSLSLSVSVGEGGKGEYFAKLCFNQWSTKQFRILQLQRTTENFVLYWILPLPDLWTYFCERFSWMTLELR